MLVDKVYTRDALTTNTLIRVPQDIGDLQSAIDQVPDGGIIELSAGTYQNSGKHFLINNEHKGFTIRAAQGASVELSGNGSHDVLRYLNSSRANGKMVHFEGIDFRNGVSKIDGIAAGITIRYAEATFTDCTFENNNGDQPSTGGGATIVADQSVAFFSKTKWINNRAKFYAAGLDIKEDTIVNLVETEFWGNRTNFANHHPSSAGGGIHLANSTLYVYDSYFEENQAGYVGGAIYAAGIWKTPFSAPRAKVYISNSTFKNNRAIKDPGVSQSNPTEGGAVHAEDQTLITINNSLFITNSADTGGGVNLYRAKVEIFNSTFFGNQAVGPGAARAFGGSISAISSDTANNSTNYPSAQLELRNVFIQGRYGSVETAALAAAGIYAAGDSRRQYGLDGIKQMGTPDDNRAKVKLENVILFDLDVNPAAGNPIGTGTGGALLADLAEVIAEDIIVMRSDALGSEGQGGGLLFTNQSLAYLTDITVAKNTAVKYGAGIFLQGSEIHLDQSRLFENEISPGVNESSNQSFGAAIFSAPMDDRNLWAIGELVDNIISSNTGIAVFDDDRTGTPIRINEVRYNSNQFYNNTFGDLVYAHSLVSNRLNAAGLNSLVVNRSNGISTDKSVTNNSQTSGPIVSGDILAVPRALNPTRGIYEVRLGYAWTGGSATLNGNSVNGNANVSVITTPGTYILLVNGVQFLVKVPRISDNLFLPLVSSD